MLAKKYRFHSRGGVRATYKSGKTIRRPLISLVHAKNTRNRQRFAVVVSKKVAKRAVKRNQIRRRVYEALRETIKDQNFTAKTDNIFVIYSDKVLKIPFPDLKSLLSSLLKESMI